MKILTRTKNILITGITGYTGSRLAIKAISKGYKVIGVYREPLNGIYINDFKKDLLLFKSNNEHKSLDGIFKSKKISTVFHLASMCAYEVEMDRVGELVDINIKFGTQLLEAMVNNNCFNLINTGSFWQNLDGNTYKPNCLYAATKQAFQDIVDHYVVNKNLRAITLKPFNIYGPNDHRNKIFNIIKKYAMEKKDLDMTNGEQKINMIHVDDLTDAYFHAIDLLRHGKHKKYFVGSNELLPLREVVNKFLEINNYEININWGGKKYRECDVMNPFIGQPIPKWKTKINLEQGLKDI